MVLFDFRVCGYPEKIYWTDLHLWIGQASTAHPIQHPAASQPLLASSLVVEWA